jgi:DNA-binding NarL/FixJ family response regulator
MSPQPTSNAPARVLLVDDNEAMLARVARVLAPACAVVGAFNTGASALDAAIGLRPDVVVLDISMPGMNGFEVAARLRKAGCTAAVVFLTVHNEDEFVGAALAAGGQGYVVKARLASDLPVAICEARAGRQFVSPLH